MNINYGEFTGFNGNELFNLLSFLNKTSSNPGPKPINKNAKIQFSPIELNPEYAKKWNENKKDFFHITRIDGTLVSNTLYRKGGMFVGELGKDKYFVLLKYIEEYYKDEITKIKERKPHLRGYFCIIDENGVEKFVGNKPLSYIGLIKDSCIFSYDGTYYNIETGVPYCKTGKSIQSKEFLFLESDDYSIPKEEHGVYKIDKKTGTFEFFK